jgi:acyl-CoA reductase-like NAD-dependent aldehyde dehydrogenase
LDAEPSVTGVLGAGNTEIVNDIIEPLCRLNSVVIYKSNPVLATSNRIKELILAPLIERGYVALIYGGAEQGQLIVQSSFVDRVTVTGSHHTFDKIVWGDQDKADLSVEPLIAKPVLAELGSVNPYIIVPGASPWSASMIQEQAEALVAYKLFNNSHICASPQVVVTCQKWPQRNEFLKAVREKLAAAPKTHCFYPGIAESYKKHAAAIGAQRVDETTVTELKPLFMDDLQVPGKDDLQKIPLREEAFCPILYEVAINSAPQLDSFMVEATNFCHAHCWGNLTCTVIVDDATRTKWSIELDSILDSMRFGTIGVNVPPANANLFPILTWGAFPGNNSRDVQSGIGQVGNFYCYRDVEKCIMYNNFSNMTTFRLAEGLDEKRIARHRAKRIGDAYTYQSYWKCTKILFSELERALLKKRVAFCGTQMRISAPAAGVQLRC